MKTEFILYSKNDCCLCNEMQEQLQFLLKEYDYECRIIKIDGIPELEHRYGARVPVLVAGNEELCQFKLNASAVKSYLHSTNL